VTFWLQKSPFCRFLQEDLVFSLHQVNICILHGLYSLCVKDSALRLMNKFALDVVYMINETQADPR
jgi:hypothetical protein